MTLDKNINGYIVISDIIDGYWVTRRYMGYTKKEAKRLFKKEMKMECKHNEQELFNEYYDYYESIILSYIKEEENG